MLFKYGLLTTNYGHELPKIYIKNFGCKVNAAELIEAGAGYAARGAEVLEIKSHLDIPSDSSGFLVINSCTVTATADAKLRGFIRRIARHAPKLQIIVGGCSVRSTHFDRDQFNNVEFVSRVADASCIYNSPVAEKSGDSNEKSTALKFSTPEVEHFVTESDELSFSRSRAFIRVQDGCDCHCSYCIVPLVRPALSIDFEALTCKIDEALRREIRELVLTGTNIGKYSSGGFDFRHVFRETLKKAESTSARVRVSSIEPEDVDETILELFKNNSACKHIHLPLQSGSPGLLANMNRKYTVENYLDIVNKFRKCFPLGSVTTDIIVGYPGESDSDFEETVKVMRIAGFERVHCFKYSPRPGTTAETYKKVPDSIVSNRMKELLHLSDRIVVSKMERHLGNDVAVLVENVSDGLGSGYSGEYFRVLFPCHQACEGEVVEVVVEQIKSKGLFFARPAVR